MRRLKRDAEMHRADRFFNFHAVEVVAQHGLLAVQYGGERATDFAEPDDQGSRFWLAARFFFQIHRISLLFQPFACCRTHHHDNHAIRSESIAR